MADDLDDSAVLSAILGELDAQGHGRMPGGHRDGLESYPIKGTIDVLALAEAVESALRGSTQHDDGKTPADLNAANDG